MTYPHFLRRIYTRYKYGISCCKAYSLSDYWAKQLKREIIGYKRWAGKHVDLTYEGFDKNIDKMIEAFDLIINEDTTFLGDKEYERKVKEGLHLFADNFTKFWY